MVWVWFCCRLVRYSGYWHLVVPLDIQPLIPVNEYRMTHVQLRLPWCSTPVTVQAYPKRYRGSLWLRLQHTLDPLMQMLAEHMDTNGISCTPCSLQLENPPPSLLQAALETA